MTVKCGRCQRLVETKNGACKVCGGEIIQASPIILPEWKPEDIVRLVTKGIIKLLPRVALSLRIWRRRN